MDSTLEDNIIARRNAMVEHDTAAGGGSQSGADRSAANGAADSGADATDHACKNDLQQRYAAVRARTAALCAPLAIEDHVPQPMADVSPPKWHLGHTAWFFEALVLKPHVRGYRAFDPRYGHVFNSYYEGQGARVARSERGNLSRPTVAEVLAYRGHVDGVMRELLSRPLAPALHALVELGLQHEQQHQELLVTDLKFILGVNPLAPAYEAESVGAIPPSQEHTPEQSVGTWLTHAGGIVNVGHAGRGNDDEQVDGFSFDNERPRHRVLLAPMQLRSTLVTNAEFIAFIADGGYENFAHWHAEGWDWVQSLATRAPLYWQRDGQAYLHYTLQGLQPLPLDAPVTHVSYYEAHAFCRWAGWRLPTEFEWETMAPHLRWGQRWEWTSSAYAPYPGFVPAAGAVGEYNGKFMLNQQVLRGASFATAPGHARRTYRNFFHAPARWQFTGVRPARDLL